MRHIIFSLIISVTLSSCSLLSGVYSSVFGSDDDLKGEPLVATNRALANQTDPTPSPKPNSESNLDAKDAQSSLRKKILVIPFINKTQYGGVEIGKTAAEIIHENISKYSEFVVVSEEEVDGYSEFTTKNDYNYKIIYEKARLAGVSAFISGFIENIQIEEKGEEVGLFQSKYNTITATVKFQLFDTTNEKNLLNKTYTADSTEEHVRLFNQKAEETTDSKRAQGALTKVFEKAYPNFVAQSKKIAWIGRIAKIDMHHYYINAGEESGLTKSQLLKVFAPGQEIFDEESGSSLGIAPGYFRGILRIVDYFGKDGAVAVVHSGSGFREKDRVEIFNSPVQ